MKYPLKCPTSNLVIHVMCHGPQADINQRSWSSKLSQNSHVRQITKLQGIKAKSVRKYEEKTRCQWWSQCRTSWVNWSCFWWVSWLTVHHLKWMNESRGPENSGSLVWKRWIVLSSNSQSRNISWFNKLNLQIKLLHKECEFWGDFGRNESDVVKPFKWHRKVLSCKWEE